jgi:hypothetical protein
LKKHKTATNPAFVAAGKNTRSAVLKYRRIAYRPSFDGFNHQLHFQVCGITPNI